MTELPIPKSKMLRSLKCSESYLESLNLPRYRIGKRDYYKLSDVPAAIEITKQEPLWESTKQKARRIGNTISQSKALGIADLLSLRKNKMPKRSMTTNGASFS